MLRLVKPADPSEPTDQGMPTIDTITDGETGRQGVVLRPSEDGGITIMEDTEGGGGQVVVVWLSGPRT